ncbi:MAG: hypothetical protein PHF08_09345 [Candidatus Riflebacteria bacterium]|nr:hypothetical protein [Candidatus Riflebacteria bacterium]
MGGSITGALADLCDGRVLFESAGSSTAGVAGVTGIVLSPAGTACTIGTVLSPATAGDAGNNEIRAR